MKHVALHRFRRVMAAAALPAAVLLVGCGKDPYRIDLEAGEHTYQSDQVMAGAYAGDPRAPAAPVAHAGLLYSARVVAVNGSVGAGPMSLRVIVDVHNPGGTAARLDVLGCTVHPEFHAAGAADPAPWIPQLGCAQAPYSVQIAAGATRSFEFLAYDAMLSHALADGRYAVTARFRLPGTTLRLDAGTTDVRLYVPNLAFHVRVTSDDGEPAARIRVQNMNPVRVNLEWGACAVWFELHATATGTGPGTLLESELACPLYLATGTVQPGAVLEASEFSRRAHRRNRNPQLAPGPYHLFVAFNLNWRTYRFPAGTIEVR
jgi:hypothetical protein